MKVIIYTLSGNGNFGNKLQHFALQKKLESLGCDVKSIYFYYSNRIIFFIKSIIKKIFVKRYKNFIKFDKKINYSRTYYYNGRMHNKEKYDFCIVGSDQVWNTTFPSFNDFYLLKGVPNKKRIAYAASFGITFLPKDKSKIFKEELEKFNYISVREKNGKDMIKKLLPQKNVEVLVDPTMLLSVKDWQEQSIKPKYMLKGKYVLCYFLGSISENIKNNIYNYAKDKGWKVINLLDKNDPFYISGPSEFLYLEEHASLICTDSFHSAVFAVLFKRPFLVFDRNDNEENMTSRIASLLSTFDLEDRKYKGKIDEDSLKCNFRYIDKILEQERKKSMDFLKKALEIKESDMNEK